MKWQGIDVFKIAETCVDHDNMLQALASKHIGMSRDSGVRYLARTADVLSDSEQLAAFAGRLCYKSYEPGLNPNVERVRDDDVAYVRNVVESGHGSVFEHASVSFAFLGCTRVFTHEMVRHRAGTAFSQESLRYVRVDDLSMWWPSGLEYGDLDPDSSVTMDTVESTAEVAMTHLEEFQGWLRKVLGVDRMKDFARKKILTSAFRRFLPIGLSTNIVVTGNHRAWRHIIEQRCTDHAEEEIRYLISRVAHQLKEEHPAIYADMQYLGEGRWEFIHHKI